MEIVGTEKTRFSRVKKVSAYLRLLRLTNVNDFFLHYILIVDFLALTLSSWTIQEVEFRFLLSVAFSVSTALLSCLVNDLFDVEIDKLDPNTTNPLARGEMNRGTLISLVSFFSAISVFLLILLPLPSIPFGAAGILLAYTYSWGVRARMKPFLDVAYHGIQCAIPFIMIYSIYQPFDATCLLTSIMIFLGGAVSELMREVRAYDFDRTFGRNTVIILGKRRGITLIFSLMFIWVLLVTVASDNFFFFPIKINGYRFSILLLLVPPTSIFVLEPIVEGLRDEMRQTDTRLRFRRRALVIAAVLVSSTLAVYAHSSKIFCYGDAGWENYVFSVDVRTVISGPESWGVAFIKFRHYDEANHYYLLLHRDGVLELTKVKESEKTFLTFVETGLSPFDRHNFKIFLDGPSIKVSLDEVQYIETVDDSIPRGAVILTGLCSARLALFENVELHPIR